MHSLAAAEFWTDGQRTLYRGDARDLCPLLPAVSFDALVTDPPYGEQILEHGDDSPCDSAELLRDVLAASRHALRPGARVAIFWSNRSLDLAISAGKRLGLKFRRLLTMYTPQGAARPWRGWLPRVQPILIFTMPGRDLPEWRRPSATAISTALRDRGWSCTKLAAELGVSTRLVTKWIRLDDEAWSYPCDEHRARLKELLDVDLPPFDSGVCLPPRHDLYTVDCGQAESSHPCEKPLWIVTDLITRLGASVLDPFGGSCTTLLAARRCGVRAVSIEIDPDHCRQAVARLSQGELFAA